MSIGYTIREAEPDDAEATLKYLEVIVDEPNNYTLYSSATEIQGLVEIQRTVIERYREHPTALWLVAIDRDSCHIGSLVIRAERIIALRHTAVLTMSVAKDWRDRGVGTALMKRAIDWCVANSQIKRLEVDVFVQNGRAIHIYEKMGFKREGVKQAVIYKEGRFHDMLLMSLIFPRPELDS